MLASGSRRRTARASSACSRTLASFSSSMALSTLTTPSSNGSQPIRPTSGLARACQIRCSPPPKPISSQTSRDGWREQRAAAGAGRAQRGRLRHSACRGSARRAADAQSCSIVASSLLGLGARTPVDRSSCAGAVVGRLPAQSLRRIATIVCSAASVDGAARPASRDSCLRCDARRQRVSPSASTVARAQPSPTSACRRGRSSPRRSRRPRPARGRSGRRPRCARRSAC